MSDDPLELSSKIQIRNVWESNLESEVAIISSLVDRYRFVAMDTEFPGIVCRPVGTFKSMTDYNYAGLKTNVNMLKMIQVGLTFCDADGNLPDIDGSGRGCVWQFNFREFDIKNDIFAVDSINLLIDSGIDFKRFREEGVPSSRFAELLMSSGVVLNDNLEWVTFHSGYDFGYLVKLLTGSNLPESQKEFFDLLKVFFPVFYDVKHMMKFCNSLHGGLNKLAELLEVERVGTSHQAGSDSLLTCMNFMKVKDDFFNGDVERYAGVLFGLGVESQKNNTC